MSDGSSIKLNKENMKQMNISIHKRQHESLTELSNAFGGVSRSNLIRIAIAEFIHKHESLIKEGRKS